jgi:sec-independent protein translocase protein TatC
MTLTEHLIELRSRLLRAFLAVGAGMVVAFLFYDQVFNVLRHPYCQLEAAHRLGGRECTLIFTGVLDALAVRLRVAMIAGIILSSPLWVYQLWAFVTPGLHRHERRWALTFAACSGALFAAGTIFAYFTLGRALQFLLSFSGDLTPLIAVDKYLSFVTKMLLIFGASFEFPLLVVMLNLAGVVSARRLAAAWRVIVFGIFVFAALITPSQDPITLCGMALPLSLLYGVALLVAFAHDRRVARREAASPWLDADSTASAEPTDPDRDLDAVR